MDHLVFLCMLCNSEFMVWISGFKGRGLGFRAWGLGLGSFLYGLEFIARHSFTNSRHSFALDSGLRVKA